MPGVGALFPRPVEAIHQIEVTTWCNLRCKYCPYPKQEKLRGQPKMMMEMAVFERALEWAVELNGRYLPNVVEFDLLTRTRDGSLDVPRPHQPSPMMAELSLTGIGEGLMHPDFVTMVRLAREALGADCPIVFSTNGILLDDTMASRLAPYHPMVYVSLHRPEKAGHAIEAAKKYGILAGYNPSPATSAFDWAGQVDWFVSHERTPCEYLRSGWGVVLVDGRITTCCLDASALGVVGHVDDPIGSVSIEPFSLCPKCSYSVPEVLA